MEGAARQDPEQEREQTAGAHRVRSVPLGPFLRVYHCAFHGVVVASGTQAVSWNVTIHFYKPGIFLCLDVPVLYWQGSRQCFFVIQLL